MNKSQLIDALAKQFEGNRKQAAEALEAVLDTISREVAKGEKVAITGFGSFEKRVRDARWIRNPRTGERIMAKKTALPKFSAGASLKAVVSGARKLPKLTGSVSSVDLATTAPAKKVTSAKKATAKKTPAKKAIAKKAPAKKAIAKKAPAKKAIAKKAPAKKATAKKAPAKKVTSSSAKKATAKKAPAKKSTRASTGSHASGRSASQPPGPPTVPPRPRPRHPS